MPEQISAHNFPYIPGNC